MPTSYIWLACFLIMGKCTHTVLAISIVSLNEMLLCRLCQLSSSSVEWSFHSSLDLLWCFACWSASTAGSISATRPAVAKQLSFTCQQYRLRAQTIGRDKIRSAFTYRLFQRPIIAVLRLPIQHPLMRSVSFVLWKLICKWPSSRKSKDTTIVSLTQFH